tara:strand:+ start:2085 stop:3821 length:1737 start_codon:yes stop_codon:yes gene_type:complete
MSIILGLNCNHADSSACIIKNGKLLFAIEEERINRIKHWAGLPCSSIDACLKYTNIDLSDITDIAINTNPLSNLNHKIFYFIKNYLFGKKKFEIVDRLNKKLNLKKDLNNFFNPKNFSKKIKVHYIDHHISHIASAFYPSNFKKAVGLSIDGFGDFCSISIAKCEDEKIHIVKKEFFPDSLGVFYETFTQLIGFKNYGDEYKMMGLSSYGQPKYYEKILKNLFKRKKGIRLNLKYFNHTNKNYTYKFQGKPEQSNLYNNNLKSLLGIDETSTKNITDLQKDLASSVQKIFEQKLLEIIKEIKNLNHSDNLVYAGGCALNSLANKKIYESELFKNIFIPYAPGDGGGSLGAALYVHNKINKNVKVSNLNSPYIGTGYDNNQIKNFIDNEIKLNDYQITFIEKKDKLMKILAEIIYENKIVGYFNGRMEFGARALGNRSILANPCNPNIRDIINSKIKRRESFRPFAPAILENLKNEWFDSDKINPYMSSVENIKLDKQQIIPSVTHFDGTGRVQSVSRKMNKDFYQLIEKFYEISNVPILLNTSFNENEPIVMSPDHAIKCFLRTEMDTLVLNNYVINR